MENNQEAGALVTGHWSRKEGGGLWEVQWAKTKSGSGVGRLKRMIGVYIWSKLIGDAI